MLAIFHKGMVDVPRELNSPSAGRQRPKSCEEIVKEFQQSYHHDQDANAFCIGFGNDGFLSYFPAKAYSQSSQGQRLFCAMDNMYCLFLGNLNNLSPLIRQYGPSKNTNEAMFAIQAYRTLRDRGPYPADQVLRDLDGSFGFVIYDRNAGTVFVAQGQGRGGADQLFWGISAGGSAVISDDLNVIKASCAKSFAPFPPGCMFHSEGGLRSFEHPMNKMKAMPRIDSEGAMCGATFKVHVSSKINTMPRVGNETNWALSGGPHT
uniref:Stem-specific protein n=1 Tax=Tamarix hispida TaxID=189793 RepID=A0A4P8F9V1_9CARY|nr:stem-specific protein [Tamarix hispida]